MNKKTLASLAGLAALACAVLWWAAKGSAPTRRPAGSPPAPTAAGRISITPVAAKGAPASDPLVRKLIADLQRLLARKDIRPGEAVLMFKDDAALARFLARAAAAGLDVIGRLDALGAVRVRIGSLGALQDELVQNAGDYDGMSGNYLFDIPRAPARDDRALVENVPFGNDTLAFIGATGDRSGWGRGVTIAVLDTGVGGDPTFGNGRVRALDIGLGTAPGTADHDGHGTSVASLIAGSSRDAAGVAPAADILSIRVTDANGTSDIFTLSQGIVAAVDAGARIVNISLGGYATNPTLAAAIGYAQERGAIIVASAGNDQAAQLTWPAADARVVSVGAVDKAEQQVTFSNSGPQLQLTAPGYGVQTAWLDGQRAYVDGTSASAPIVAGAVAAVMSANPSLSAADAVQLLTRTANDAGPPGYDPAYGNGILNVGWALNAGNPGYADTAIASHYYDASNREMDFVVQNRGGMAVTGLSLVLTTGRATSTYVIPSLAAGQSEVVRLPIDAGQLDTVGQIRFVTTLVNPPGLADQVPSNNRRASVLAAPTTHP